MAGRLIDDAAGAIERMRAGLAGPELHQEQPPSQGYRPPETPYVDRVNDPYDDDYDYYWGNVRVPLWIALIMQIPWRQRLDVFVIGFIVGLIVAGVAVLWGLVLAQY